jgi:hypothetical protein
VKNYFRMGDSSKMDYVLTSTNSFVEEMKFYGVDHEKVWFYLYISEIQT